MNSNNRIYDTLIKSYEMKLKSCLRYQQSRDKTVGY